MDAKIFRVNYKSDFILTLTSDAGWMTPFCIKFWTGSPMLAYYASYDGTTHVHCTYDPSEPTKLTVQFDDHHLPIGNLKYQVAYHFTVADFPENTEDEVTNQANVTTVIDGDTYQVMLDLNGETAPEIQFALPAYANELQRIQNEQTRIAQEQQRIAQEQQRISQEAARVTEFNGIKAEALADHQRANEDHSRATSDHQNALADRSQAASDHSRAQSDHTTAGSDHSQANSDHIRAQSDHNTALSDHQTALSDHTQANTDHTRAESDHTRATADSSTAAADHRTASTDHTQANTDHARAESDHQRVETDLAEVEEFSNSLGAYDISAANATGSTLATYPDLATALGTNGSNIPEALRKGGMSVKFVQSSDNKYVQYRLMANEFTTDTTQWQSSETKKTIDSYGFAENTVGSIKIAQRPSSIGNPFKNLGYFYDGNGKKRASGNYACTDLLPIIDTIRIGVIANYNYAAILFYDENKQYISNITHSTIGTLGEFHDYVPAIPTGAKYFAVTVLKAAITECYVVCGNVEQYLDDKIEFPELMHTIYDTDLVRENKIYTDAGVGATNNDIDAVKLNVSEGDVLRITCNIGNNSNYHAVKFYTSNGGTLVEAKLLDGDFVGCKLVVPANATFAICQGRTANAAGGINPNHIQLKVDLYSKYKKKQAEFIEYDALMLEPCQGYYRKGTGSNLPFLVCSTGTLGYRVSVPIPVKVGDVITAGTAISYPFDTVVHVTFDANKDCLGTLNMSNGSITITQAMWDSGVRYIAISYRPDDTPSLTVTRSSDAEPFVLDKTLRMKISPYEKGFFVWIPSKQIGGKYIGYRFIKYYKKWDSLEYEDGDGNTQTLTDVVNSDVWNCEEIYDENMQYMSLGHSNFIFAVNGESFTGDGHGNEASMFTQFLVDGKIKEIASGGTYFSGNRICYDCNSFECTWKSNVYRHGSGQQYADTAKPYINTDGTLAVNAEHYLNAKFDYGNKIRIENILNIKRNGITFMSCNGAMIECNFGDFSYLSINDDNNDVNQVADDGTVTALANSINLAPGTGSTSYNGLSVKANEVKMWGKGFAIMQRMEPKYNDRLGKCGIYIHKYANRIKCYFHPVVTTRTASAIGVSAETFNAGDVISVVDYREIEV